MKEYTFKLYDNFLPDPKVIKSSNIIVNFKYCNISELSWIDEDFNDNRFELPFWVNYFDMSYNSVYAFFKGTSHDYPLPKELKVLNLSFNKLDFMSDEVPPGLIALNISNNTIKYIPKLPETIKVINGSHNTIKGFDQELPNLEKLNLSYNHIQYFGFDKLKENLKFLDLTGNQLKEIRGNIFPSNLEVLKLKDNKLEKIPDLPPRLIELDLSENKIKQIDYYPATLKSLDVSSNDLLKLSDSLLECKELEKLNYEKNDTIEISLGLLIWIDKQFHMMHHSEKEINLKELYSKNYEEIQTVYNDSQNAHNLKIRNEIIESMERIVTYDELPQVPFEKCCDNLAKYFKLEDTVTILRESNFGEVVLLGKKYTLEDFFPYLYNRIVNNKNAENLANILENEIQNSKAVCFSGRIEAYMSVFVGFYDDIYYSPSLSDQILAKIEIIKNRLHKDRIPADSLNYQVELRFYMTETLKEMNLDDDTVNIWLCPIDENIEELIKSLETHYNKDIKDILDIIKMRKVVKHFFLQYFLTS